MKCKFFRFFVGNSLLNLSINISFFLFSAPFFDLYCPEWRDGLLKDWKKAAMEMKKYLWSSYGYYRTGIDSGSFMNFIITKPEWLEELYPRPEDFEKNLRSWASRNASS